MKPVAAIAAGILLVACLVLEFQRLAIKPWPPKTFDDPVMEFKYGSIGAEVNGFPYVIWRELPTIFHDRIPRGWAEFGFLSERGSELPVGISVRRTGVRRVGFNCATCHTARIEVGGNDLLVLGAPAAQLDIQSYLLFLIEASADPRLTPDAVFKSAADAGRPINWFDRRVFRYVVFPKLKAEAAPLAQTFAWMRIKPLHGPGRTDAGNVWRARWGMHPERDQAVGTVDFPSVWNQQIRVHGWFHWDGNNNSLTERNYSAALAGGATDWLLERRLIGKVSDWLMTWPAPRYPLPLDARLAAQGAAVYARERCGECHDQGSSGVGQVTPLAQIGTDPERAMLFSPEMVRRFQDVGKAYSWRFSHYRSTRAYANMPLDGIWARAPYLHNGSVPDLAALLTPPAERPATFWRGCSHFDPVRVGYACTEGFSFDTQLIGNGNGGHDYGTHLPAPEKAALIEYLKSL